MEFVEAAPESNDSGWPTNPEYAYVNDGQYAITTTSSDTCIYYTFDFSDIPGGSQIIGIRVCVYGDWHDTGSTDITAPRYQFQLSWDAGSSWTTAKETAYLSEDAKFPLYSGSPSDLWGHSWTLSEIQDTDNFRLKISTLGTATGSPQWRADFIQVAVYYYGGLLFNDVNFSETIESSIVPLSIYEQVGINDSGSSGTHGSAPPTQAIGKAGTAVTDYQSSSTTDFDAAATYQRMEGCIVSIVFNAADGAILYIGDEKVVQWPDDSNPIVQQSQYGLLSIDSITYSSDYGTPQRPAQAAITVANKKYGNAITGIPVYIPDLMSQRSFLGGELIVYSLVRKIGTSSETWRQRIIFRGSVTDVIMKDKEITFNATQIGHGDLPVPDQKITDDTFYYEENDYSGSPGKEGNKIEERMGSVIPIGIGRFDVYAVKDTWQTGHIFGIDSSTSPIEVFLYERTARGIIPAMMGVKYPMMPAVAAVRNWTGRHGSIWTNPDNKILGRSSEVYQQIYLYGSKKGRNLLYITHGGGGLYESSLGAPSLTAQPAYLLPIYTWDTNNDRGLPFCRDMSPRSIGGFGAFSLANWSSAGILDHAMNSTPYRPYSDGDSVDAYGVFVNIAASSDGFYNILTERPYFGAALQCLAIPFESESKLEGWCRLDSYFATRDGVDIEDKANMLDPKNLDGSTTINYTDSGDIKGWGVFQVPNAVDGAGKMWGVRVGGIWNPEAGTPARLEMMGRYSGPYDPNPNHVPGDHPLYWNGWPMLRLLGNDYALGPYMHESVNTQFVDGATGSLHDLAPGHYVKPGTTGIGSNYRYFAWWIRAPWFGYGPDPGPYWMVSPGEDPNAGNQGMTQEWEFMSWGWNSGGYAYLLKYPWEVRFAAGQVGSGDESLVINKAWLEVIFQSKMAAPTELPQQVRTYPRLPASEEGSPAYRFYDPGRFRYLWEKGIYPTQQSDVISSDDIYISGNGPTKSGGEIVEKCPDIISLLISHYADQTIIASGSTFGSFDTALTMSPNTKMSLIVNYQSTLGGVIGEVARQSQSMIDEQIDDDGNLIYRYFVDTDDPATDDPDRLYRSDISFKFAPQDIFGDSFQASTTRLENLSSDIRLRYGWHLPSGTWANEIWLNRNGTNLDTEASTYVAAAQATYDDYGVENQQIHEFPDIWNKTTAEILLKWLFNKQRRRLVMVDFTTYVRHTDLRCGHVIQFSDEMSEVVVCPSESTPDWENILFNVLGVSYSRDDQGFMRVQVLAQEVYVVPS